MAFRRSLTLFAWAAALFAALLALVAALLTPGLAATSLVAGLAVLGIAAGLWRHIDHSARATRRFVEALGHDDRSARFSDPMLGRLGDALDGAMARVHARSATTETELRFAEALLDDLPVAFLAISPDGRVRTGNKAARLLMPASGIEDLTALGETFAKRVAAGEPITEIVYIRIAGRPQRALVRVGRFVRQGEPITVVSIQPIEAELGSSELAAQTDLVRVFTHEILNSLTPVLSLAAIARDRLEGAEPDALDDARMAIDTLARRAEGLRRFVDAYREVARPPEIVRRPFAAVPWAADLAGSCGEWPRIAVEVAVAPGLVIDGDPDFLAQLAINLLRNACQAIAESGTGGRVVLAASETAAGVELGVTDDGPGIPAALIKDVTLPFFTTRAAGSGIGLHLCRQIALAHGGSLDIRSGEGRTAIVALLPRG